MALTPHRHASDDISLRAVLHLIQTSFDYMQTRVDPPSSVHLLNFAALKSEAQQNEVWSLGSPPYACAIFRPSDTTLMIAKLAVHPDQRGAGLARQIITLAERRAAALGLQSLTLQTRVELSENHAIFRALGFDETARTTHPGYPAPTSITFTRPLPLHLSK